MMINYCELFQLKILYTTVGGELVSNNTQLHIAKVIIELAEQLKLILKTLYLYLHYQQ